MKTIGIFKSNCPNGWSPLTAWNGKFLQGATSYGDTGGTDTHYHSINMPSQLSFGTNSPTEHPGNQNYGAEYFAHNWHEHTMDPASANTSTDNHLPEYIDVVFCYMED